MLLPDRAPGVPRFFDTQPKDEPKLCEQKVKIQAGYNEIAFQYLEWLSSVISPRLQWTQKLIDQLRDASSSHVAELGCGPGAECSQLLAKSIRKLTAVDISESQVKLARTRLPVTAEVLCGDMMDIDFGDRVLDGVVALNSLFHLPLSEQPIMLERISSWLKPDGVLLINLATEHFVGRTDPHWLHDQIPWDSFSTEENIEMIKRTGFEILETAQIDDIDASKSEPVPLPMLWILAVKQRA